MAKVSMFPPWSAATSGRTWPEVSRGARWPHGKTGGRVCDTWNNGTPIEISVVAVWAWQREGLKLGGCQGPIEAH